MQKIIDLNADLGESFGAWNMGCDSELMPIISSANIACGFHAGDPTIMHRTVQLAKKHNVAIGAHPGFPDLQGFGRRPMHNLVGLELQNLITYQIGALQAIARSVGTKISHVKLHGALANMATESQAMSDDYMQAVKTLDPEIKIMAMATGEIEAAAVRHQLTPICEIFADRAYNDNGTLVPRTQEGAVIHDAGKAAERILQMLEEQAIISVNGTRIPTTPQSICVHGDNPEAVSMASHVRKNLEAAGYTIQAPK